MNKTDEIASTHLGKKVSGSSIYDPTLLVAIPRSENRKQYNIESSNLPFEGFDIWHGYEFSTMTQNNIPVTRLLKIKYDCNSEYLIESKSLKLYLNSFNMSSFGSCIKDCLEICKNIIEKDLSLRLQTKVYINFLDNSTETSKIYDTFTDIMNYIDESTITIEKFKEAPELIEVQESQSEERFITFNSLRSNCRVTHQPDFGDVFIYYKSNKHIIETSLLKYLTSFRSEYHFHEECCEMIFKRLYDALGNDAELFVSAIYTRRGGIDICPVRYTKNCTYKGAKDLLDITKFARNGIK